MGRERQCSIWVDIDGRDHVGIVHSGDGEGDSFIFGKEFVEYHQQPIITNSDVGADDGRTVTK